MENDRVFWSAAIIANLFIGVALMTEPPEKIVAVIFAVLWMVLLIFLKVRE